MTTLPPDEDPLALDDEMIEIDDPLLPLEMRESDLPPESERDLPLPKENGNSFTFLCS